MNGFLELYGLISKWECMLDGCVHCSAMKRKPAMSSVRIVTIHGLQKMLTFASLMLLFYGLDMAEERTMKEVRY